MLTVGMPVYNGMPHLVETMESLRAQTVTGFEILAIVDGGSDASLEYLEGLRWPNLRILFQQNQGVASTLNRMLWETRTPWLVRQDADDVSYPERMERLLASIHRWPGAGMIYSHAEYHPRTRSAGHFRATRGTPAQIRSIVRQGYIPAICHPAVALNVEKTLALGGYRVGLHAEDADLWWRMAMAHDVRELDEVLVGYRQHAASVSSRNLCEQELHGLYVQYLLLSRLRNYIPSPLASIRPALEALLPAATLRAKQSLRECNIQLAKGERGRAFIALLRSFAASPAYLVQRLRDEFSRGTTIANGLPPQRLWNRKEQLWPLQFCRASGAQTRPHRALI